MESNIQNDKNILVEIFKKTRIKDYMHVESEEHRMFMRILKLKSIIEIYDIEVFKNVLLYFQNHGLDVISKNNTSKTPTEKLYAFLISAFKNPPVAMQPYNTIDLNTRQGSNQNNSIKPKSVNEIKKELLQENTESIQLLIENIEEKRENQTPIITGYDDEEFVEPTIVGCNVNGCINGYIMSKDNTMDFCECYKKDLLRTKSIKAGIPKQYITYDYISESKLQVFKKMYNTNSSPKQIDVNEFVSNFEKNIERFYNEGWNLMFYGSVGAGKTTAATIILKKALNAGYSGAFIVMQNLKKVWTGENLNESLKKLKDEMYTIDFLVIDELGQEFISGKSEHQNAELDLLLRERSASGKSTIITTNASEKELGERYGVRMQSLLSKKMIHLTFVRDIDLRTETEEPTFL